MAPRPQRPLPTMTGGGGLLLLYHSIHHTELKQTNSSTSSWPQRQWASPRRCANTSPRRISSAWCHAPAHPWQKRYAPFDPRLSKASVHKRSRFMKNLVGLASHRANLTLPPSTHLLKEKDVWKRWPLFTQFETQVRTFSQPEFKSGSLCDTQQPDYQVTQDCWTQMWKTELWNEPTLSQWSSIATVRYASAACTVTKPLLRVFFYICMRVHGHHGYFTDLFKGVVSAGKRDALKQHEFDWHVFLLLYSLLVKFNMLLHNAAHHSQVW